ncbi:hypothetical protein KVR01_000808 [Diaporthe batatas]|uniref:uncharacterized protein n=1 Tax=Diaporthe batatas TaxID=748121 RepID=UPI001D04D695|nr:uncharacterized protein KVR01_000808 [Diaporthe batatas]KAG8170063.1 hypothetical protein KVR01_000808 [Diaporthe batatas]
MTTTSSLPLTESLAPSSSHSILTVTITRDDIAASSTVSTEAALITDSPNTVSSDLTLVYVFTKSATDESSSSGSSSGSRPSGLSPGIIAGIVIGAIILLILLVLLVFCTSRRFARKKRQEVASLHPSTHHRTSRVAPSNSSYHAGRSLRSPHTVSSPKSPPQELATHFNRLEFDGRGKPAEVVGSYIHPAELHAGSTTDLVAQLWRGASPPPPRKDEVSVVYVRPKRRGDDITLDENSAVCLSPPGTWETESWGASVSDRSNIALGPGSRATVSNTSSRDTLRHSTHTKE